MLQRLLGELPVANFLREHYLRLPYAARGGCEHLAALGNWELLARLLDLPVPAADVLVGRAGSPVSVPAPQSAAEGRRMVAEGMTLSIRHAQRHDAGLAELAREFQQAFAGPVDIHLLCTPAGAPGFGWHYDAEEVFVLQTHGTKEWWLRKNTANPWPLEETIPRDQRYEREIMPVIHCRLEAGDWLYIPAGYWHSTRAETESLSLSVGVRSAAAIDVYDFVRRELLASLEWRQRLPPAGTASAMSEDELVQAHAAVLRRLGEQVAGLLADEEVLRAFLQERRETE